MARNDWTPADFTVTTDRPLVEGELVTYTTTNNATGRSGTSHGVYEGSWDSEGELYHYFRGGAIGTTSQLDGLHGFPASQLVEQCAHVSSTLIETRGLGGWQPVEVYACDECGHRTEQGALRPASEDSEEAGV